MITISTGGSAPPSEQIRAQIAAQIYSRDLSADHRLPSIRQLAADLRVAPGTVAKAYSELEQAGLITTSRTRGSRVVGPPKGTLDAIAVDAAQLVEKARTAKLSRLDLIGMIQAVWPAEPPTEGQTASTKE